MLVRITPWAQWALFAKNGSDATALAVRLARSATGKRVILRAPHAYHGAAALWAEGLPRRLHKQGVLEEDVKYLAPFQYNDLASVQAAMDAVSDDVAGVMVSAFMWDYATPHELPTAEFLQGVRKLCDERGAILICDDVRSSFRVHPAGTWADPRYPLSCSFGAVHAACVLTICLRDVQIRARCRPRLNLSLQRHCKRTPSQCNPRSQRTRARAQACCEATSRNRIFLGQCGSLCCCVGDNSAGR